MLIPLTSGAYSSQSLIANAQRCVNLYVEANPKETTPETPTSHYPRPGLKLLSNPPTLGPGRCLYPANDGSLYAVVNQSLYYIDPNYVWNFVGNLITTATTPVYMADNGTTAIVVDGSPNGYQVTLAGRAFSQITDVNFLGSTGADFLDSFICLNKPDTNEWYSTISDEIQFNALFVGVKTAWPDNIIRVVTVERQVWIFGPKKSEVWYNAGNPVFPFSIMPGNIIEQGCAAPYSPAKMDTNVYWLSQTPEGDRMVMRGNSQNIAQRISTHAIEFEFRKYPVVSDAIGSTYQVSGHSFYLLTFPTADKTWVFDEATQQWHEDNWIDTNGVLHRCRNTFNAFSYGVNIGLDWNTGALYQIDPFTYTDNTASPVVCIRSFPHVVEELKYTSYSSFVADVATGYGVGTTEQSALLSPWSPGFSSGFGPISNVVAPLLAMRVSRDGGYTFGNYRFKKLVSSGHYRSMERYRANGIARDMVFELNFTAQMISALNGGYVDVLKGSA